MDTKLIIGKTISWRAAHGSVSAQLWLAMDGSGGLSVPLVELTPPPPTTLPRLTSKRGLKLAEDLRVPLCPSTSCTAVAPDWKLSARRDDVCRLRNLPISAVCEMATISPASLGGLRASETFVSKEKQLVAYGQQPRHDDRLHKKFLGYAELREEPAGCGDSGYSLPASQSPLRCGWPP